MSSIIDINISRISISLFATKLRELASQLGMQKLGIDVPLALSDDYTLDECYQIYLNKIVTQKLNDITNLPFQIVIAESFKEGLSDYLKTEEAKQKIDDYLNSLKNLKTGPNNTNSES